MQDICSTNSKTCLLCQLLVELAMQLKCLQGGLVYWSSDNEEKCDVSFISGSLGNFELIIKCTLSEYYSALGRSEVWSIR